MANAEIGKRAREEALKTLIRKTISSAGDVAPDALPHRVKERLHDQVSGEFDLDRLILDALAEIKKSPR